MRVGLRSQGPGGPCSSSIEEERSRYVPLLVTRPIVNNGPGRDYGRPTNTGVKIPATRVPLGFHRMSVHSPRC